MEFIHPNFDLAQQLVKAATPHVEKGTMLALSLEDILTDFESWFVHVTPDQKLAGFFCFRRPHVDFAEIGSVCSVSQNGAALIEKFEALRHQEGQTFGCAITKNKPQFFVQETKGKILKIFPDWYQKTTNDKHFIQWS